MSFINSYRPRHPHGPSWTPHGPLMDPSWTPHGPLMDPHGPLMDPTFEIENYKKGQTY